jgi:signal peptidase I
MQQNILSRRKKSQLIKAVETLHEKDPAYKRDADLRFYLYLAAVVVAALAIRLFIFEPVRVDGNSMYDTLINNEYMFVEKVSMWVEPPRQGEIITCFYPGYTISCVKRVIATPGQTIYIQRGQVYIDGELIDESAYITGLMFGDMDPVTVPEDCVFVMGDNRNDSHDSRAASVGFIPYCRIVGRCRSVIWPLSERRKI